MGTAEQNGNERQARLQQAFRAAHYTVLPPGACRFTFQLDHFSEGIARLHAVHGVACSALITAWNPDARRQSETDNRRAQHRLIAEIESQGLAWISAENSDPAGEWPTESSILVLGIAPAAAQVLGRRFGQAAIVLCTEDAIPRLAMLK